MDVVYELLWDLAKDAIGSGLGVLGAFAIYKLWEERHYGGWSAILYEADEELDRQNLGVQTAKSWVRDDWARKLGLKSLCSDNGRTLKINVLKVSEIDDAQKQFVVHLTQEVVTTTRGTSHM